MKIDSSLISKDKPLVSILLAVYKPKESWFIEQLISLNEQTYENVELLVYDDCPDYPIDESIIKNYITKFSYKIIRGIQNKGSNKAFEELTIVADGEFFAYCDQDDIWENDKISLMIEKFLEKDVTLVCSDLSIIDENGNKTANSITDIRKRIVYKSGYNLAKDLLMTNFVTGCAMMVRKDIAKKAIPFEETLIHDQWIAIIAAINGKIEFINKPLVKYRQHSFNQTGILKDIYDKKTYYDKRIDAFIYRYKSLQEIFFNSELEEIINDSLIWLEARKNYFFKPSLKCLKIMIRYKDFHKISILIECFLPFISNNIFKYIIKLTKKGIL
ncbi:glycosyltransferase family 2 protein [Clostridium sp.]|uniref:glycosyltransferase family 2 protein n=1 Tax=Clostridium sp. TaxID=1506 RepID=UPI002846CD86|nr:glycosyltransferase family 2 protein [Clostridium sp.]MDR3593435.1 glycosyltransferase family 2 protein [Clostridium sp.]